MESYYMNHRTKKIKPTLDYENRSKVNIAVSYGTMAIGTEVPVPVCMEWHFQEIRTWSSINSRPTELATNSWSFTDRTNVMHF